MAKCISGTLVLLFLLILCGCSAPNSNDRATAAENPPYCNAVWEVAGQTTEEVMAHLGLQAKDFQFTGQTYQFKQTVSYCDQSFQMHLCPYRNEENGYIQGVEYRLELDKNQDALNTILNLRKEMELIYGSADEVNETRQIESAHLSEAFEADHLWDTKIVWILTEDVPEEIQAKFAQNRWALHFRVLLPNDETDPQIQGKVYVQLTYKLTQAPGKPISAAS